MIDLPPSTSEPFDLGSGPRSALLLHGFTGTPYEVRPLGVALAERGIHVLGPLLAGHGDRPEALSATSADQILDSARQDLDALDQPLALCGLSMGALLAGLLAAELGPRIRALVLMAPAARLRPEARLATRAVRRGLWKLWPQVPKVVKGGDCADPEGSRRNPCYNTYPMRALLELDELRTRFLAALPDIKVPTLILHGARDRTIPPRTAREVAAGLGASEVELHLLKRSRHVLPLDVERDQVVELVSAFLKEKLIAQ